MSEEGTRSPGSEVTDDTNCRVRWKLSQSPLEKQFLAAELSSP